MAAAAIKLNALPAWRLTAALIVSLGASLQAQSSDVTQPGDRIVATSDNSPASDGVANAIDDQPTKYLNFDEFNTGFTVTPAVGATMLFGLTLTSANDHPERDPASYTLEGSSDGTNFVLISSGNVPQFPTRFHKQQILFSEHTNSYTSYRLIFRTVVDPIAANSMQIAEVEFLGTPPDPRTNQLRTLVRRQPVDAPVLLGFRATFRVELTGPWQVQWYSNSVAIPGATAGVYTTPPVDAHYDGARYKAVVSSPQGTQTTDEAVLSIFTPSTSESIGLNFTGDFGASGPFFMLPE